MGSSWKLEDAKARFSEVVRKAQSEGAQRVTVRGKETVAVISIEDLDRLLSTAEPRAPLVPFLESLYFEGFEPERSVDRGRDPEF